MIKKDTLGNLSAASLNEALRCGECLHYKKHANTTFKMLCNMRGIRATAIAPKCFTPDVSKIAQNSDQFVQIAALFNSYTPQQRRIWLAVLREPAVKGKQIRKDIKFGTKVYFHGLGRDYINNYLSGYVMGMTSNREIIISGSPDQNTRGRSYLAYMKDTDTLMTYKEWKVKKAELQAAGKIFDPASRIVAKPQQAEAEPPTIDDAPQEWYDKREKEMKKGKRQATDLSMRIS